jgi:hypothetical protein
MAFRQNLLINLRRSYLNSLSPCLIRLLTVYESRFSITSTEEPNIIQDVDRVSISAHHYYRITTISFTWSVRSVVGG